MNKWHRFISGALRVLLLGVLTLVVCFTAMSLLIPGNHHLVAFHLLGGFYFFLQQNIPAISSNAATWIPGLLAFFIALIVAHRFLRSWAKRRGGNCSFSTTLCLGMVLPLLFAISFIVPGVLLQLKFLQYTPWLKKNHEPYLTVMTMLWKPASGAYNFALEHPQGRFPDSLPETTRHQETKGLMKLLTEGNRLPVDPPIYLGSGLTLDSDPSLPLLISPPYRRREACYRQLITVGQMRIEIPAEEVDSWINQVIPPGP